MCQPRLLNIFSISAVATMATLEQLLASARACIEHVKALMKHTAHAENNGDGVCWSAAVIFLISWDLSSVTSCNHHLSIKYGNRRHSCF